MLFHSYERIFTLICDFYEESPHFFGNSFPNSFFNEPNFYNEWRELNNYFLITFTVWHHWHIYIIYRSAFITTFASRGLDKTKYLHSHTIYFMCFLYHAYFYFYYNKNCTFFLLFNMIVTIKLIALCMCMYPTRFSCDVNEHRFGMKVILKMAIFMIHYLDSYQHQ